MHTTKQNRKSVMPRGNGAVTPYNFFGKFEYIGRLLVRCSRVFKLCTRAVPHLAVRIQHCYAAACAWVCARQVCDAYAAHGIAVDLLVSASSCFTPIFTAISPRIDLEAYLDYFHAAVSPTLLFSSVGFGSKRCVNLSFCCHPLHAFKFC